MDKTADLLGYKIDALGVESNHTRVQLEKHVTECAVMQKKVLIVMVFLAGWIVAHSPEAGKLFLKVFTP